jgi:hypothetical protein
LSCASTNPFSVPEGSGGILKNSYEYKDGKYYGYCFKAIDGVHLDHGWIAPEREAYYIAPAGLRKLVVKIVYAPNGIGAFKPIYNIWAMIETKIDKESVYYTKCDYRSDNIEIWIDNGTGKIKSDIVNAYEIFRVH